MNRASAALPAIYFTEIPTHNNEVLQQGITNAIINIKVHVVMQGRGFAVNNCFRYEPC